MTVMKTGSDSNRLDQVVAEARRNREERERGYREQALKLYPWVCGRCAREFSRENLSELTVHHRDHNHDNNPPDGSNWELLCIYCHDNEHSRYLNAGQSSGEERQNASTTFKPFANLDTLLKKQE
ncbi:YajD family HNH nuclease [Methylocaldum sp. RMAD-M]|uniref:YajD family HNH nuclease n=1 Tax=Methylocaldum sp. RMAD-M TaxID=2806557 RepID=UPI00197C315E|nr:YajD family HNH nuclease [Methylocaldum sp. RMAD-M]MBP1150079.1 putative HNH restriction endonuclease [Methylocaldum sp. RMAD-M]